MQQFFITMALLFSSVLLGQTSDNLNTQRSMEIKVTVVNVLNDQGDVKFALYNRDNFMATPLLTRVSAIEEGKSTVLFDGVEPGVYAILCFHDANANERMDFDEQGFPVESYGATNNVMNDGPPNFEDAKFEITNNNLEFEIKF